MLLEVIATGLFLFVLQTIVIAADYSAVWTSSTDEATEGIDWGDYDGDGDLDFTTANFSESNRVYSKTDGVDSYSIVWTSPEAEKSLCAEWGDFDGDGDLDIVVGNGQETNRLYENDGGGSFTSIWNSAETDDTRSISWGDFDIDGDLDFIAGNFNQKDRIYSKDDTEDTYTIIWETQATLVSRSNSVELADYDADGDLDLLVGNYSEPNDVYRNDGFDGTGTPIMAYVWSSSATDTKQTISASWGDFDNDGDLDHVVGNSQEKNEVFKQQNTSYFQNVWTSTELDNTRSIDWGDFDADGYIDQLVGNKAQVNRIYKNSSGNGNFTTEWSSTQTDETNSIEWFDYNGDGDLDLLVGNNTVNNDRIRVYKNNAGAGNTAPSKPVLVDEPHWATGQVTLEWNPSTDAENQTVTYSVRVGTCSGCDDIVSGKNPDYPGNAGIQLSYTITLPAILVDPYAYYWSVAAIDTAGAVSEWADEDLFILDETNPSNVGHVNDGTAGDRTYTPSDTALSANWGDATDTETGILKYWYAIGTTPGYTNVTGWVENATATFVTHTGLSLDNGDTYYFTVKAENGARMYSDVVNSNGQLVDITAADAITYINDGTGDDIDYVTVDNQLSANWEHVADAESGLRKYWYGIGTSPGGFEIKSWTDNGTSNSVTYSGSFVNGQTYYFVVKAENNSGIFNSQIVSDGQLVDIDPPLTGAAIVNDGLGADEDFTTSNSSLSCNWSGFTDPDSGVIYYHYALGTTSGATDVIDWTSNGTATTATLTGLSLSDGQSYYFSIIAENNAGLQATPVQTDGIYVDSTPPTTVTLVNDGDGNDEDYTTYTDRLSANWSAASDPETAVLRYWYCAGTSEGASDVISWTDNSTSTRFTNAGITLSVGPVYYVTVKSENSLGLISATKVSDGITVDYTPPTSVEVSDGTGADIDYTTSTSVLSANWTEASDSESTIILYRYAIGTSAGASDIVEWTYIGTARSVTVSDLTLVDGTTYYFSVAAINGSTLQSSITSSDGIMVDSTPPPDVTWIYDGTAADVSYVNVNTQLSANWAQVIDSESQVLAYYYAIGTSPGATNVTGWTGVGTSTSVTKADLSLTNNQNYYFSVKVENYAGLQSGTTDSNGVLIDIVKPADVFVADGSGTDIQYTTTNTQLAANWTESSDSESGLLGYWYAIGTTAGATDVVNWTDISSATSVVDTSDTFSNGQVYYFSVKAEDVSGLQSNVASSNGQMVDVSPPADVPSVNDGTSTDLSYTTSASQLSANWTAATDAESGLSRYYYAAGTTSNGTDILDWTNNGTATSVTRSGLSLSSGTTYYFSVKSQDNAGLQSSPVSSNGILVDTTAPEELSYLRDGVNGTDIVFTGSTTELSANWADAVDSESGVAKYYYAIGTAPGTTDVVSWTDNGADTFVTATGLTLTPGETYYFSVKSENNAGLVSIPKNSTGVTVDTSKPSDVTVVNDGTGSDVEYIASDTALSANWTESSDEVSGIVRYWYAVGTSAGATDTVDWTDNLLSTNVTVTGLTLNEGQAYYFTVKAENGLGEESNPTSSAGNGQTVDVSNPADVSSVNDGVATDITYSDTNTQISANWTESSDAVSGIVKYWYCIGSAQGLCDTRGWTDNGLLTSADIINLALNNGSTYYTGIRSENGAGLLSTAVYSNGWTVDTTAPGIVFVMDGTGSDITYTTATSTLSANWTASFDDESGLVTYWYAVGTSQGGNDVADWSDSAGTGTSVNVAGLSLVNGQTYYFSVKTENGAGLVSTASNSNGQKVDFTPPADVASVTDDTGTGNNYITINDEISASWTDSSDAETGIVKYWYAIGTTGNITSVRDWKDNGLDTYITKTGLSLQDGTTYIISVKAENGAGLQSEPVSSAGQIVDTIPPDDIEFVYDGQDEDISYTSSNSELYANWTASNDEHSPVVAYRYAVGTYSGGNDVVTWTGNGLSLSVHITGLSLQDGQTYYISVKADNEAGLESYPTVSDGQTVYVNAPSDISNVYDGTGADLDYTSSTSALSANWTESVDSGSGIESYFYRIVRQSDSATIVDWTDNGLQTYVQNTGLSLSGTETYFYQVKSVNELGLESNSTSSDGITVDLTPPVTISTVADGVGEDITFTTNNAQLQANWSASSDGESGLQQYWYSIIRDDNGSEVTIIDWTSNAQSLSVTKTNLNLSNGNTYKFKVRAENTVGLASDPSYSNGVILDFTAPDVVTVSDGTGFDCSYTNSLTELSANWTPSNDNESDVTGYWFAIGTGTSSGDMTDIVDWTSNATATAITKTGLSLQNGETYYFSVKVENGAGLFSNPTSSNGQLVDIDSPSVVEQINDGTSDDIAFTSSSSQLSANWTSSFDPESGVANYWYGIGTTQGGTNVLGWTNNANNTGATASGLSLSSGITYYFTVRVENAAGLFNSPSHSDGVLVDTTSPSPVATVRDGTSTDLVYTTDGTQLSANWTTSSDSESGVIKYFYAIGKTAGGTDVADWTDNGLGTSVTVSEMTLTDGQAYYFSVYSQNNAGLNSTAVNSSGVIVDTTAPDAVANVNDGTGSDIDITSSTMELSANWSSAVEPHTGIATYYYSIGTATGATDVVNWVPTTDTSATVDGLALANGGSYYFNVKSKNLAGLQSEVASSDGVTINADAPVVEISSPESGAVVSGNITIMGTAFDFSLTGWELYYGAGTSPSAWKEIETGTASVQNGVLAQWDVSQLQGTYTLKLGATDSLGLTDETTVTFSIDNSYTYSGSVDADKWVFMSLPVQPDTNDILSIFSNAGIYTEYKLYIWDPTAEEDEIISKYRSPETLDAGDAFFIKSFGRQLDFEYSGSISDSTQEYSMQLYEGWNMVGTPFNRNFTWSLVEVSNATGTYSLSDAADEGIISSSVYTYDDVNEEWVLNSGLSEMLPGVGYLVRAYEQAELLFDPGAGMSGGLARVIRLVSDYNLKISARAGSALDSDNFIGTMNYSSEGYDVMDAPEPPVSPKEDLVSVYFQHSDWGKQAGRFTSDYRPLARESGHVEEWKFIVETNCSGEAVEITWDESEVAGSGFDFELTDVMSGMRIDMSETGTYSYTSDQTSLSREFEITVTAPYLESAIKEFDIKYGWNLVSVPLEPGETKASVQILDDVPGAQVFQYYDGDYYEGEKADIQAGFGYWIYSEEISTIDIEGTDPAESGMVEVPLKSGWNLIGNPFGLPLEWDDESVSVVVGENEMKLREAVSEGVVSGVVFDYDGSYRMRALGSALVPWKGYALRVFEDSTIIFRN
ncbi:MAG TPA: FG-GAP-like repeat-containing protein [bacterium]|nr:FG-GAP-like repeat-containing protein [bacterium]